MTLTEDETAAYVSHWQGDSAQLQTWRLPPLVDGEHEIDVLMNGHQLVAISGSTSLAGLILPDEHGSSFLHKALHWRTELPMAPWWRQREASPPPWFKVKLRRDTSPDSYGDRTTVRQLPTFHASRVISRRSRWKKRLGKYLGQAASIILDGKLCLPLDRFEIQPIDLPNMPSCFSSPEATAFVDHIVAEYLVTNVASWYHPSRKPICICPIGTVPKKTHPFFRLVIDARKPNEITTRWSSNMRSLASTGHIFQPGSVCFSLDIGKAYICSPYQGCRQHLQRRMRADGTPYVHVGCESSDCSLSCAKCMLGFRWRGHVFAFNCPMFGARVSGNILDALLEPVDRWLRAQGIPFTRWVDDSLYAVPPLPEHRHDTTSCGGAGQCWMCDQTMERARKIQARVVEMLEDLGFTFNEKLTLPSQQGEFIGMGWDTLKCTFRITEGKAEKIAAAAEQVIKDGVASSRDLAQIRGKLIWFSPCLSAVRLLTRRLNKFIGSPDTDLEWDARVSIPSGVMEELSHWTHTLRASEVHERPMWKMTPAQLFVAYNSNSPLVQAYLEIDASIHGWGCTLRVRNGEGWRELGTSVLWGPGDPVVQVHCEAEALARAIHLFRNELRGLSVLHATDCDPTVGLPERGSAASARLQESAMSTWKLTSSLGIHLASVWVPGDHMVKTGTDYRSRDGLIDTHTARLEVAGWELVNRLAASRHLHLAVDWFADHLNNQCNRFWAKQHVPGAEGVDALAAPSWAQDTCLNCGASTSIDAYLFPPVPLLDKTIAKAQADGCRGLIIVPRLINSVWWPVLAAASTSQFVKLHRSLINSSRKHCDKHYGRYSWNAVTFDFSQSTRQHQPCQCTAPASTAPHPESQIRRHETLHAHLARYLLQEDENES